MKANQLLRAARHARASGAPIETVAEDKSVGQQMTPAAVPFPSEGALPSLGSTTAWLNAQPLTAADLRGNVVLIDFWTYTCINWLRSLPYVRAWAEKYKHHGVVVIGVHTPEFTFEQDIENVRRAAKDMRVEYPIAIDNDYALWYAFTNHYWPALYIVDAQGHLRYHHFGEGQYEQSERIMQHLLAEATFDAVIATNLKGPFFLSAALLPQMAERGYGKVINITTAVAHFGAPGGALYGSSKAAFTLLTKSWAAEFGPSGVNANAIAPGAHGRLW